ncbi:MAG: iron-containing alcohol dehydrogenase [Thermoplasmata archaeon]
MGYFTAPQIAFGAGAIEQLSAIACTRACLVVDPSLVDHDRTKRIIEEIGKTGATVEVVDKVEIGPTLASIEPVVEDLRSFGPDWIVAVGGGSTIDTAKAGWVRYADPEVTLGSVTPLRDLGLRRKARLIAIPSTSGSGSEASWQAHLRDPEGRLIEIASRELVPDWALLDPLLPMSMPREVLADTAADAFGHALEALVSEWSDPFSDAMARETIRTAAELFPRLMKDRDDLELRERWHAAATMAGLAVSNAQTGAAHALAHALYPYVRLPHGRLVGIVLPYLLDFNYPSARERYGTLASIFEDPVVRSRGHLAAHVQSLLSEIGLPATLSLAGVTPSAVEDHLEEIVQRAMSSSSARSNPRIASAAEWRGLVQQVLRGPVYTPDPMSRAERPSGAGSPRS